MIVDRNTGRLVRNCSYANLLVSLQSPRCCFSNSKLLCNHNQYIVRQNHLTCHILLSSQGKGKRFTPDASLFCLVATMMAATVTMVMMVAVDNRVVSQFPGQEIIYRCICLSLHTAIQGNACLSQCVLGTATNAATWQETPAPSPNNNIFPLSRHPFQYKRLEFFACLC